MKKIISIALILIIMLPTIGLSIGTHICGGEARDYKLVFDVQSLQCEMQATPDKAACPSHPIEPMNSSDKMDCCDNLLISIETDQYQNAKSLNLTQQQAVILFELPIYSLADQFIASQEIADANLARFLTFPPPKKQLFVRSQVLLQTFLN